MKKTKNIDKIKKKKQFLKKKKDFSPPKICGSTDLIHQKSVINNHVHHRQLSLHKQPRNKNNHASEELAL